MARYSVDYSPCPVIPTAAFSHRTTTPRPLVPVHLQNGALRFPCYALVDSGADDCLFPASFASRVGLDLSRGRYYEFAGAGSMNQPAWFFELSIQIGTVIQYQAALGFTPALEQAGTGLLGQNGFFDKFKVEFDLRNKLFHIEE